MRLSACVVPMFLLVAGISAHAQQKPKTDALEDELLGPVKSVDCTHISAAPSALGLKLQFGAPGNCNLSEYDQDGNKIANGQIVDGKFVGETRVIGPGADGRMERVTTSGGSEVVQEILGPYGKTEETVTADGKVTTHQTFAYDTNGHVSDWRSFDGAGTSIGRTIYRSTAQGDHTLRASYDKDNKLLWQETWDPETDDSRFATFDPSGAPLVTWRIAHGKLLSFWEASDKPGQFGQVFWDDIDDQHSSWFRCNEGGGCTTEDVRRTYLGPGKHNPSRRETHDSQNNLLWSADFEYELDTHNNWTHRKIWVTVPGETSRTLFAEDARTISYWE